MTNDLVFIRLHGYKHSGQFWVRAGHVSEIHQLLATAMPFEVIGARVLLTTGREIAVQEKAEDVLEILGNAMFRPDASYFNSEDAL